MGPFKKSRNQLQFPRYSGVAELSKILGPIYAICTPLYAFLRHQHCSYEIGIIKYTVWATCKKDFSILAQTV